MIKIKHLSMALALCGAMHIAMAAPSWQATSVYTKGDTVSHQGRDWEAQWWTQGEAPGLTSAWQEKLAAGQTDWQAKRAYKAGEQVSHQGALYQARWWTQGEQPGNKEVWKQIADQVEPDYRVIGYYISWGRYNHFGNYTPLKIRGDIYTHINYAFAGVSEAGEVIKADPGAWGDDANFAELKQLKKTYPHLKTLISVGGGGKGSKYFSNAALTQQSREKFANSAVQFIRSNGFDGVDIDWEFPTFTTHPENVIRSEDLANFPLLFKTLRATLDAAGQADGKRYLLTLASEANPVNIPKIDWKTVASYVDWINVMSYEYAGAWSLESGHVAPLFADPISGKPDKYNVDGTIQAYLQHSVAPSKLNLGMVYPGHIWTGCPAENQGRYTRCQAVGKSTWGYESEGALDYQDIKNNFLNKNGFTRYWSSEAKVPYLFKPDGGVFITYEDPQSIAEKLQYLKQNKLGGAFVWEVTADREHDLSTVIVKSLRSK